MIETQVALFFIQTYDRFLLYLALSIMRHRVIFYVARGDVPARSPAATPPPATPNAPPPARTTPPSPGAAAGALAPPPSHAARLEHALEPPDGRHHLAGAELAVREPHVVLEAAPEAGAGHHACGSLTIVLSKKH